MSDELKQCFPVIEYLDDELAARGMSMDDLAATMGGDVAVGRLALDFLRAAADANDTRVRLGGMAEGFERSIGIPAETWVNLHAAWCECVNKESGK